MIRRKGIMYKIVRFIAMTAGWIAMDVVLNRAGIEGETYTHIYLVLFLTVLVTNILTILCSNEPEVITIKRPPRGGIPV